MLEGDRKIVLFPIPIPITVKGVVIIMVAMNLITAAQGGGGVSVAAHLGGLFVGWGYMKLRPKWAAFRLQRRIRRKDRSGPTESEQDDLKNAVDNIFDIHNRPKKH